MGDTGGDVCTMLCGGCCIVLFSGLTNWCNTKSYGSGGCGKNSNAGCCGSCCSDSFDEDRFDEQVKQDLEKTRDPNAPPATAEQLKPTEGMTAQSPPQVVEGKQEEQ